MIFQAAAFIATSIALFLNYPQAYEIINFQNYRNLQMSCAGIKKLYLGANKRNAIDAIECSAFVVRDSYYNEYLLPSSFLKKQKSTDTVTVCSAGKPIFEAIPTDASFTKSLRKCQKLIIRTKDDKYVYAGYITPTHRAN
jgi:hypothetical protein